MNGRWPLMSLAGLCLLGLATTVMGYYTNNYGDRGGGSAVLYKDVTETTTTDDHALFGSPMLVGNKLYFAPTAFASAAPSGDPNHPLTDQTNGTLTMQIWAPPGDYIKEITFSEVGDWQLTGLGTAATQAQVGGSLTIIDLDPDMWGWLDSPYEMVFPSGSLFTLPPARSGVFRGSRTINLEVYFITKLWFNLDNNLSTTCESGTTSFIQKKGAQAFAVSVIIPEPATLCLLVLGLAFLRRRG